MSVQIRILILLLLVSAVFVGALIAVRQELSEYVHTVEETRNREWLSSVEKFLGRQQKPSVETAQALAASKEVALWLEFDNLTKLAEVLDDKTLKSSGVHAVWVYGTDGALRYSHSLHTASVALDGQPLPGVDVVALTKRNPEGAYFFFEMPINEDEAAARRFVEVRSYPIRAKVGNADDSPRILGTLFAGCLFGKDEVKEMSLLHKDDKIKLASDPSDAAGRTATPLTYSQPMPDWNGHMIEKLVVSNNSRELADLKSRGEKRFTTFVGGALVLFVVLFLSLGRSIVRPLKIVIMGLHSGQLAALEPLSREKAEFGELARLIQAFFEQQTALVREMLERIGAEKALRESEEMLRHSQKMEAVGRLAGGVAHDFNNLLTAIIGYAELLKQRLVNEPAGHQAAELIHQAGEQAAGLTRQLLAFSRKQLLQPRIIDLNTVITNLLRLLQRIIGEHIEIRTATDATNGCVKADPGQIEQVIINLGVNARDAMPRGGRLTIRTVGVTFSETDPATDLPPGDYVALEVTDTGDGMDAETISRIFEPFFTTKGPGKGTGLGLATVYGIIKQSHGGIAVESERGCGSTFRILLPCESGPAEGRESTLVSAQRTVATEMILVVEDEEIVRTLVCEILQGHGYRVFGTNRGSEALRLVSGDAREIDLLISDVVMPEMSGATVAQRVRAISPRVRVLFVSGYSEHDMADQGLDALSFQVLQKPFSPAALVRKVREILDAPILSPPAVETDVPR